MGLGKGRRRASPRLDREEARLMFVDALRTYPHRRYLNIIEQDLRPLYAGTSVANHMPAYALVILDTWIVLGTNGFSGADAYMRRLNEFVADQLHCRADGLAARWLLHAVHHEVVDNGDWWLEDQFDPTEIRSTKVSIEMEVLSDGSAEVVVRDTGTGYLLPFMGEHSVYYTGNDLVRNGFVPGEGIQKATASPTGMGFRNWNGLRDTAQEALERGISHVEHMHTQQTKHYKSQNVQAIANRIQNSKILVVWMWDGKHPDEQENGLGKETRCRELLKLIELDPPHTARKKID